MSIGLVLSGGGSRGAYEVGVLRFLREALPRQLGRHLEFDVVTGTSVGALNAAFLAATADALDTQAERMCATWRSLKLEELISLKTRDLLRAGRLLLGAQPKAPEPGAYRHGGLLDTEGLERFVASQIPWRNIRRNINRQHLQSLAVSATHVGTGHTVVFIDSASPLPTSWSRNPFIRHRRAAIGPRLALASAAIPLLFPAVKLERSFYVDGGLRNNTPMAPAIRLGANRLLVITLRHQSTVQEEAQRAHAREDAYPSPLYLAGKALNSLLLDPTEYDLERMDRINGILEAGAAAFGEDFEGMLSKEMIKRRGAPLRHLEAVHIAPSVDIGELASDFIASGRLRLRSRVTHRLIERLAQSEASHEADILSYLLFDGDFASDLMELGYRDAAAKEDDLLRVFGREGK